MQPNRILAVIRIPTALREKGEAICIDRSSPYQYDLLNPFTCDEILCYKSDTSYNVIVDGGVLLGNQTVNQCNPGEVEKTTFTNSCNWTTASDVPGKIQLLCWDNRLTPWTPVTRYTMNNSAATLDYKGLYIAGTPVLKYDAPGSLSWSYCYQVSGYNLYKDNVFNQNVVAKNITGLPAGQYYVVAVVTNAISGPSNTVTI